MAIFPKPEGDGARFERDHLVLFREIVHKGESIGTLYLNSDLQERSDRLESYAGIILLFMAASLVVTFLLSWRLQRIIATPIVELARTARTVSTDKNYSVRAAKVGNGGIPAFYSGSPEYAGTVNVVRLTSAGEVLVLQAELDIAREVEPQYVP